MQWARLIVGRSPTDPLSRLLNIISDLPATLEAAAQVVECPQTCMLSCEDVTTITTALHNILFSTDEWQKSLFESCSTQTYTSTSAKLSNPSDTCYETKLFPLVLNFSSAEVAFHLVTSWAIQLQIIYALLRLQSQSDIPGHRKRYKDATELAHKLCQSMEYVHRNEMGTLGPQMVQYPRWVLTHFFRWFGNAREMAWCEAINGMKGRGYRFGIGMMMFQDPR